MADVLYRKYRPHSFQEVYGQEMIVDMLRQAVLSNKIAHGLMFSGPRGTGKTTMARLLAKAVNCLNFQDAQDVCNHCDSCKAIDSLNFLDLYEIDAASNRGIDEIRMLREKVNFSPVAGKFKIYIIDEVHMLTKEAFNALLKTLEEPPAHIIFILATTEPHKIPITILSRVQRFDFQLATLGQMQGKLLKILEAEGVEIEEGVLDVVYHSAEGSFRDAESMLGKIISHQSGKVTLAQVEKQLGIANQAFVSSLAQALVSADRAQSLTLVEEATRLGVNLVQLAKQLASYLRTDLLTSVGKDDARLLAILSKLVQLQLEAKQIDDVRLLWDILIIGLTMNAGGAASGNTSVPSPAPVEKANPLPAKPKPGWPTEKPTIKPSATKKAVDEEPVVAVTPIEELMTRVRKQDLKLWTVLKGCQLNVEGNKLVISAAHEFNFQYLQQEGVLAKISPLAQNLCAVEQVEVQMSLRPISMVADQVTEMNSNVDLVESFLA